MNKLQELKATAAKLQQQIEALEKPKQWKPRGGYYESTYHTERDTVPADVKARCAMNTQSLSLAYVDEFGGDWEAACNDNHGNYFIVYNHLPMTWEAIVSFRGCKGGAVYMSKDCAEGLVAKLNSGEVVL